MVKIVLSGANGRMGRAITELASGRADCLIFAGIDAAGGPGIHTSIFDIEENPDVVLDFSHPSALPDLLSFCKMRGRGIPLVLATTGYSEADIVKIKAASQQIPVFFTGNMSLGINLLADLARRAAKVLGGEFDAEIIERHHNRKLDAPSGTAIMLADAVNGEFGNAKKYVYDRHSVRKPRERDELGIHSVRGGTIVGEHEVIFAGHDEVVTLTHSAYSRGVFAAGALNAAVFLAGMPKGLYDMSDLLQNV